MVDDEAECALSDVPNCGDTTQKTHLKLPRELESSKISQYMNLVALGDRWQNKDSPSDEPQAASTGQESDSGSPGSGGSDC